jgi:hypothetical protein
VHPIRLPKLRKRAAYGKSSDITILVATNSRDFTVLQVVPESLSLSHTHVFSILPGKQKTGEFVGCGEREREREREIPTYSYILLLRQINPLFFDLPH